jgi:predicted ribosome quality control (RQC) complex YloA/Tae2 family protein
MSSKGRPYRTISVEGFEVLIGRGARENDDLTFRVAEPRDFWLHVGGGTPGSHVVVRNVEGLAELPRSVLEAAAGFAAWYSKARAASLVEVHVCRVADVSKRRGAPAGQVELSRWKKVRVRPAAPQGAEDEGDEA